MTIGACSSPLATISLNARPSRWRSPRPTPQIRAGSPWNLIRADVGRNEAWEVERVFQSHVLRHLADVVAIVERGNTLGVKIQHGLDVADHGGLGRRFNRFRIGVASGFPLGERPSLRQITVDRIVRAGLVGNNVWPYAAAHQLGENI